MSDQLIDDEKFTTSITYQDLWRAPYIDNQVVRYVMNWRHKNPDYIDIEDALLVMVHELVMENRRQQDLLIKAVNNYGPNAVQSLYSAQKALNDAIDAEMERPSFPAEIGERQ